MTDKFTKAELFEAFVNRLNAADHEKLWWFFYDDAIYQLRQHGTIHNKGIGQWPSVREDNEVLNALSISNARVPEWVDELEAVLKKIGDEKGYVYKPRMRLL